MNTVNKSNDVVTYPTPRQTIGDMAASIVVNVLNSDDVKLRIEKAMFDNIQLVDVDNDYPKVFDAALTAYEKVLKKDMGKAVSKAVTKEVGYVKEVGELVGKMADVGMQGCVVEVAAFTTFERALYTASTMSQVYGLILDGLELDSYLRYADTHEVDHVDPQHIYRCIYASYVDNGRGSDDDNTPYCTFNEFRQLIQAIDYNGMVIYTASRSDKGVVHHPHVEAITIVKQAFRELDYQVNRLINPVFTVKRTLQSSVFTRFDPAYITTYTGTLSELKERLEISENGLLSKARNIKEFMRLLGTDFELVME